MRERQRVHNNDYCKRARDNVAPDSLCPAWLHNEWCQVTVDDLTGMQSVCGSTACRTCSRLHEGLVAY